MIQLSGAGKRFGHKLLFENVDWLITNHDHIGLVGGNGTGKSTLMKVLAGMDTFDYGSLIIGFDLLFCAIEVVFHGVARTRCTGARYALPIHLV